LTTSVKPSSEYHSVVPTVVTSDETLINLSSVSGIVAVTVTLSKAAIVSRLSSSTRSENLKEEVNYILNISCVVCQELSDVESETGWNDPFIVLRYLSWEGKTTWQEDQGSNASWCNLGFEFEATDDDLRSHNLTFDVFDHNYFKTNALIGYGSLSLAWLLDKVGEESDLVLDIMRVTEGNVSIGSLHSIFEPTTVPSSTNSTSEYPTVQPSADSSSPTEADNSVQPTSQSATHASLPPSFQRPLTSVLASTYTVIIVVAALISVSSGMYFWINKMKRNKKDCCKMKDAQGMEIHNRCIEDVYQGPSSTKSNISSCNIDVWSPSSSPHKGFHREYSTIHLTDFALICSSNESSHRDKEILSPHDQLYLNSPDRRKVAENMRWALDNKLIHLIAWNLDSPVNRIQPPNDISIQKAEYFDNATISTAFSTDEFSDDSMPQSSQFEDACLFRRDNKYRPRSFGHFN
jgi:C2 domain